MKMDFSKLTGHLPNKSKPAAPACAWLSLIAEFDAQVALYCADSGLPDGDAIDALSAHLAQCAASIPDALAYLYSRRPARNPGIGVLGDRRRSNAGPLARRHNH